MNEYVVDTMGIVIYLEKRRLGAKAKNIFNAVETKEALVIIPGMVHAEVLSLSKRNRIKTSLGDIEKFLHDNPLCKEYPLSFSVVKSAHEIADIPELHDRLIAATARFLKLPLITNDPVIQASSFVNTVWS